MSYGTGFLRDALYSARNDAEVGGQRRAETRNLQDGPWQQNLSQVVVKSKWPTSGSPLASSGTAGRIMGCEWN